MGLKKQYIHFKNWVAVTAKKAYLEIKRDILLIVFGFVSTIANAQATGAGYTKIPKACARAHVCHCCRYWNCRSIFGILQDACVR